MATRKGPPKKKAARRGAAIDPAIADHRPTLDDRDTVEQMKFCGERDAVIARALRIPVKVLRHHYRVELEDGPARKQKEVIGLLFESARKSGNVSALKRLAELGQIAGAAAAIESRGRPRKKVDPADVEPERPIAAPKPGKKEQRQAAANAIGGKFAPPDPPRLVVDNAAGGK